MQPSVNIDLSKVDGSRVGEVSPSRIQVLDPLAVSDWDSQVAALPGCSFFHSAAWARTLEESYGYKPVYLARTECAQIRGLLPMMEVSSWLTGRRGVSLPFSDSCDTLGAGNEELFDSATVEGRVRGWKYWETRGSCKQSSETPRFASFHTHSLVLSRDEELIFAGFDNSVRRAIRKAQKIGVTVEISRSLQGMETFYSLHCKTRQKHGVPPQPFAFFAAFHRHVLAHNLGFIVIASSCGRPISAGVFVHFGNNAIYKYGASDEAHIHMRGANLVMWHAIQWYARAGFQNFDFGRTEKSNEGLRRFKMGWGTVERSASYYRFDLMRNCFLTGSEPADGVTRRILRKTPQPISRLIGRILYRHVA